MELTGLISLHHRTGTTAPPSKRFAWLGQQGAKTSEADHTASNALRSFPRLKCLEAATGATRDLFELFATAVIVVEFYLTDDRPRACEPPVAVDP
jgi:hypothetical protein